MNDNSKSNIRALRGWVKFNLSLKGFTLTDLAKKFHCDLPVVFHRPFPRAERIIADALDCEPWELWPERYGEDHKPNRRNRWYDRGQMKINTKKEESKEKNEEL
jgi:lambda repressor-like predicted transcriptional regulator